MPLKCWKKRLPFKKSIFTSNEGRSMRIKKLRLHSAQTTSRSKLTLQRVTKMSDWMLFKVSILVINDSAFSQRVAILTPKEKSKTITLLLSLKDQTMIEWLQWVVCKKLFMKLKVSTVNAMRICTCGVTGWELNLDHVLYFKFWLVPFCLISLLCSCTTNVTMGKAQWMVSEEP